MISIHIETANVDALFSELDKLRPERTVKDAISDGAHFSFSPPFDEPSTVEDTPAPQSEASGIELDDLPSIDAPTMEQTRAKLNELRAAKGPKAVRAILTAHNVSSFTDLKPTEYAAVVAEVEDALNATD